MGRIHQLDAQTANMIAAGEVVERPMGVIKELVENAIDAGSTKIVVSVEEGGTQKITVSDNGCGMDSADAVNAFKRHATSKIADQNDLWAIHTLGFRGEALPSIASVSKLTLVTSDGNESTKVRIEYGETVSVSAYPCNQGTEITVEGLFYRTPARLKHLRSGSYENSLIQDVIMKFAMSHPEIAFVFISSGKEAFRTSGSGSLLEVIYQCWGREAAQRAVEVNFKDYDYTVYGYLIKPDITRASRNFMNIFLNGRMVKTYRLYQAVMDGYEDFIVKGRKPLFILDIKMDAQLIDVNVHPSKWEVRLSKENQLEYLIRDNVADALKNELLAPVVHPSPILKQYETLKLDTDHFFQDSFVSEPVQTIREPVQPEAVVEKVMVNEKPETESMPVQDDLFIQEAPPVVEETRPAYRVQKLPQMQVIGQLHEKFILCACEKGLAVLDQHACQERVHYEQYQAKLNQNPVMMDCLVPISLTASDDLVRRVDELNEAAQDLHVEFEAFGHDTLLVRSVPSWMKELEEEQFLQDVIDNFRSDRESRYTRMEKKKIATLACHHSIRFNRPLTMTEMNEVVRQLNDCENPYHCPHGRPTFIILEEKELAKDFLR